MASSCSVSSSGRTSSGSAWASTPRPASGDAARTWRARVRACERPIRVRNKYITASTMPHATLQPNAAASKVDASNGPALAIDSEPMIVTAMMRPNSTSEIRSTGLSSCSRTPAGWFSGVIGRASADTGAP